MNLPALYYPFALAVPYLPVEPAGATAPHTPHRVSTIHLFTETVLKDHFWVTEILFVVTVLLAVHITTRRLIEKVRASESCGINDALVVIIGIALCVIAYCGMWLTHAASDHHVAYILSGTFVWICYGVKLITIIRIRLRNKALNHLAEDQTTD
jgi:hypothetical protein